MPQDESTKKTYSLFLLRRIKMKTLLVAFVAMSFAAQAQDKPLPTTYKVDSAATSVTWLGKKVAGPHNGDVKTKSGSLTVLGEEITAGTVVVDMTTIND